MIKPHAAGIVGCGGGSEAAGSRRIDPILSDVFELGEKSAEVEKRTDTKLVVRAAGEAEAGPVIPIFPHILADKNGNRGIGANRHGSRRRFNVVITTPVPIVTAADHYAEALLLPEALADRPGELIKPPAASDGGIAAHAEQSDVGLVGGFLGD